MRFGAHLQQTVMVVASWRATCPMGVAGEVAVQVPSPAVCVIPKTALSGYEVGATEDAEHVSLAVI
jgi:hypothetical protein